MLIKTIISDTPIMDNIIEPTAVFDFSTLNLENPVPLQGGNFFTKLNHSDKKLPVYTQLPKCTSKHGIIRNISTKKAYTDLQFNYFEADLQTWFENLEIKCRELIYNKKDIWFQTEMSLDDIENMFISPTKSYKSGKFLIIRAHIPTSKQIKQEYCLIYDENEKPLDASAITETSMFIPLIHIEGIKFSSKSFQLDINLRQMMVLSVEDDIKNGCMIKYSKMNTLDKSEDLEKLNSEDSLKSKALEITSIQPEAIISESNIVSLDNNNKSEMEEGFPPKDIDVATNLESIEQNIETVKTNKLKSDISNSENSNSENSNSENSNSENSNSETIVNSLDELNEVELEVDNINEEIQLKKPKDVYSEIYKVAHEKAKHMKQAAIEAYLEARNIKTKYMLNDLIISDDEFSNSGFEE